MDRRGVDTAICCVADRQIAAYNRRFRMRRGPTDVLTFVYRERPACVGEIFIGSGVAARQALARRVPLRDELLRLAVHGLIHLAGYDHQTRGQFMGMRQKEFEVLMQIL